MRLTALTLALALAGAALAADSRRPRSQVRTVFGRHSKAAVRYVYRKAFARQTFNEICANVAAAQRKLAREIAVNEPAPEPLPAEELPPMPAENPP